MIALEGLSMDLGGFRLESLSLRVAPGEFFMIVGPSGAGKTLLLEAVAGLRPLSSGRILIAGKDVTAVPPEKRGVGIVYQDYALFPHLTVEENIRWGLRFSRKDGSGSVDRLVDLLRLRPLLRRSPGTLSGGEQQRTALARALAVQPSVLLLDEPLSALDPAFREELRDYLAEINREGMTLVMVTHDFGEVLSLGDRVAVVSEGSLQQTGNVRTVFREPANRTVAEFVGMKNIFQCEVRHGKAFLCNGAVLEVEESSPAGTRLAGIRPEDVALVRDVPDGTANAFPGRIASLVPRGMAFEVIVETEAGIRLSASVLSSVVAAGGVPVGGRCVAAAAPDSVHVF